MSREEFRMNSSVVRLNNRRTQNSSDVLASVRRHLSPEQLEQKYKTAKIVRTKNTDLSQLETTTLNRSAYISQEDAWAEDQIPVYSRRKDWHFKLGTILLGTGLMFVLLAFTFQGSVLLRIAWQHFYYGEHPTTHLSGLYGLPGESTQNHTNILAVNQDGLIVVIVLPPDVSQTKVYKMQQYEPVHTDAVPFLSETTIHGDTAIEVTVENESWSLIRKGPQFVLM